MRQLSQVLGPGAVVGFHPEGTRNKGTDRYTLVGSRPGVGRLIQQCHPDVVVLPYFIIGMTNDFIGEVKPGLVNGPPVEDVRILFGTPKRAGELAPQGTAQVITDRLMAEVQALGLQDRARYGADGPTP
jgi:1-acyl-sn-glycerol-3-phosphate acyltransferase